MPDLKSYLEFKRNPPKRGRVTPTWDVISYKFVILGEVRWYGGWRQYVFYPGAFTLYNHSCLDEISKFCFNATSKHRENIAMEKAGGE